MGKARAVSKRRRKAGSFHYKRRSKLKRQRQKELRKCGPMNCDLIRESWNEQKSLKTNMKNLGLSEDPNKLLNGPCFYEKFKNKSQENVQDNIVLRLHERLKKKKLRDTKRLLRKKASNEIATVADKLSELASKPSMKNFKFGPEQIKFCSYMLEKYGDDYESMARDQRNFYQESPGQIRTKIKKFLSIDSNRRIYENAKQICISQL
ncbi:Nucleolar protein 16 [Sarcoptes scabiei]|uniref:Nucleolar protein 16 n=1 Tax=Sarcoptes scabiei TaxID=52283 RepID=A0A834R4Q8_SARSC|nr:Nucleolar protein 16 [Sarcoptes scabiei]